MTTSDCLHLGQAVLDSITKIRQKTAERDTMLAALEMQAMVLLQGIDPEDVASYSYNPEADDRLPSPMHRLTYHSIRLWRETYVPVYNLLNMKDGRQLAIFPVPAAKPLPADNTEEAVNEA